MIDFYQKTIIPFFDNKGLNKIPELVAFKLYFENTYIGKGKKKPVFHPDSWNMFHEIMNELSNTNNGLEQLNSQINQNLKAKNTIYTTIEIFQNETLYMEVKLKEIREGSYVERNIGRKEERIKNKADIKNVIMKFDHSSPMEFIKQILDFV